MRWLQVVADEYLAYEKKVNAATSSPDYDEDSAPGLVESWLQKVGWMSPEPEEESAIQVPRSSSFQLPASLIC